MTSTNLEAPVESKRTFERIVHSQNVVIRHYHGNNVLFNSKEFKMTVQQARQPILFCGIHAHYKNERAECRIKDITTGTRTSL